MILKKNCSVGKPTRLHKINLRQQKKASDVKSYASFASNKTVINFETKNAKIPRFFKNTSAADDVTRFFQHNSFLTGL